MPFIQLEEDVPQEELRLKMDQPVVEDLKKYTEAFGHGQSVSAVVQEILRKVMARDKDFQKLKAPVAVDVPARSKPKSKQAETPPPASTEKVA
jgi:hypothetical protein